MLVAATFAQPAGTLSSPTSTLSTVKPTVVDTADTAPYRSSLASGNRNMPTKVVGPAQSALGHS
jgi:hypothetical protein